MARPQNPTEKKRAGTIGISVTTEDIAELDALRGVLPGTTRHGLAREAMRLGLKELRKRFPEGKK